jgi:predicted branched-subunit amino acid permease
MPSTAELRRRYGPGARAGLPYGVAAGLVGISFGVLAESVLGGLEAVVFSAIVFAGSSQFAARPCSRTGEERARRSWRGSC